ncbi:hypothetical protein GCM10017673_17910 [Streptosporangium violaceochromogenes]|nr:hypothetical protein GCM10017673_17910 [Streptosporangium violaceochromogenes]
MADVGGDSSGRSGDRYIPSYDAPTAPIPAVRAEDGTVIHPRVPRRFPIGDGEETVLVPRPGSAPPPAGTPAEPAREEAGGSADPTAGGVESAWMFPAFGFPAMESVEPASVVGSEPAEPESPRAPGAFARRAVAPGRTPERETPGEAGRPPRAGAGPVRPRPPAGAFGSGGPGASPGPSRAPGAPFSPRVIPRGGGRKESLLMRIGDIPIRVVYSFGAALLTALAVFLIFVLFSGDQPADPPEVRQKGAADGVASSAPPSAPPIALPGLPVPTAMRVLPGTPSPVLGVVTDAKAAITYAKLGAPWTVAAIPSFTAGQRVGTGRLPGTLIASGLLPGDTPRADLKTDAQFRGAATGAVRWTLRRHYPAGSRVTWTASQRPATGKGWTLGYRVTYVVKGRRHTSQAALTLLDIGRRKPAMLFVTVPDTNKRLWADIAPLMAGARPL